jgi:hypothetical protein
VDQEWTFGIKMFRSIQVRLANPNPNLKTIPRQKI